MCLRPWPLRCKWPPETLVFLPGILALLLMTLLVILDATTTAIVINASISFILAVVIVQPVRISEVDTIRRKVVLYAVFFISVVGTVVLGVTRSMSVLILVRILQGIGGGGLDVLSEVIAAEMITLQERATYIRLFSLPVAPGIVLGLLGPILRALFSEYADWRLFISKSFRTQLALLGWVGIMVFAVGCTVFALPLSWAGNMYPWSSWRTILPLVLGFLVLVAFPIYESRPQSPRTAQMALIGSFIHGLTPYILLMYWPSLDYIRTYRWEIRGGWVSLRVGVGLFAMWHRDTEQAMTASFQIIAGIGIGTLLIVPRILMQASAPTAEDQALAIGILVSFRLFDAVIGLWWSPTFLHLC
ncbi:hypothetical protein BO83DRAFT_402441 [Aspergillus eucalypticola CBS 122712]|uniref:Major facilitator superfamily (MFS) profile domain-containing protein n=1 Tax=Aspergillus eucalypticola (strain CBS 122712 / IBT 29274) TaxID=1448314 RepID=A0A317URR2_ASPEC|nr:uncharacterized protein BO83DRAFT_402441 [Aspergillus eucalypticola CBS 122712]PWY64325.1 hypothetical protein BO83DRAFT_402441 [Aspergillus eucalypticola CBS 122712]